MRAQAAVGVVLFCIALFGCGDGGPQRAEVAGTVKLDGQPIKEGAIQFIPVEGTTGPSAGDAIKDGKFHLPRAQGAVVGKNKIELRAFKKTGRQVADPTGPPGARTTEVVQFFPPEFNDRTTLIREIKSGTNTIDLDLQSKSDKK